MSARELGILGEKIAENYLQKKGYKILDKNYSPKFISGPRRGEIDIIAKKDDIISFIEVKTLRQDQDRPLVSGGMSSAISPEEKVDYFKQRKLIKMAENWLIEKKIPLDSPWQVDVIAVRVEFVSKKAKINHFQNVAGN